MTEWLDIILPMMTASIAGASAIVAMTPMKQNSKLSAILNMLALNVGKARKPHSFPWSTFAMKPEPEPEPNCGYIRPGEWQCNCKDDDTPRRWQGKRCLHRPPDERPNRRAAIEATKRKLKLRESRNALVG